MKQILILTILYLSITGCSATKLKARDVAHHKVIILDQLRLNYPNKDQIPFGGISDLAYDTKNNNLYMIGDRSYLYHFKIKLGKTIQKLTYHNAYRLTNQDGKVLNLDSEGLDLNHKKELIVSFERHARVSKINTKGKIYQNLKIPPKLQSRKIYKNSNSMFEAIVYHKKYGILLAAEHPIKKRKNTKQTIYSLDGKEWHFDAESYPNSAVTALEVIDDNTLLVLERAFNGLSNPIYITLKRVSLNKCNKDNQCSSEVLRTFSSPHGLGVGNFEGLTKVAPNRYLMVSDNNEHPLISTSLVYFELTS